MNRELAIADVEERVGQEPHPDLESEAAFQYLQVLCRAWRLELASHPRSLFEAVAKSFQGWAAQRGLQTMVGLLETALRTAATDRTCEDPALTNCRLESLWRDLMSAVLDLGSGKSQVLVLGPEPSSRNEITAALVSPTREVHIARNAGEAHELLSRHMISLLFIDVDQPVEEVLEFLRELRSRTAGSSCPVVAYASPDSPLAGLSSILLGADRFIYKPLYPAKVRSAAVEELWWLAHRVDRRAAAAGDLAPEGSPPPPSSRHKDRSRPEMDEVDAFLQGLVQEKTGPVSIAVVEFDRIPSLRRTLGAEVCDQIISRALSLLGGCLRHSDTIADWKDGLSVAVMAETSELGAVQALQGALQTLRGHEFDLADGRTLRLTFSAGVAAVDQSRSLTEVLAEARKHEGIASSNGGDCVVSKVSTAEGKTILVAEDDAVASRIIRHRLEREGYEVIAFSDGQSALRGALDFPWIAAIFDVRMPELDGLEILARLRQHPAHATKPVILMSSVAGEKDVVRAFKLGASDYIAKPFSPAELCARLERLLRRNAPELGPAPTPVGKP